MISEVTKAVHKLREMSPFVGDCIWKAWILVKSSGPNPIKLIF